MDSGDRLFATIATGIIWGAAVLIVGQVSEQLNSINGANAIWVLLLALIVAAGATSSVWRSSRAPKENIAEKAKHTRVQKLLRKLSDEELDELRKRLSDSDGEMSLDELLSEKQRKG